MVEFTDAARVLRITPETTEEDILEVIGVEYVLLQVNDSEPDIYVIDTERTNLDAVFIEANGRNRIFIFNKDKPMRLNNRRLRW